MRHINLNGQTHKVYECRHDFEGFCEKFTYPISINKRKMTTPKGFIENFVRNSLLSCLSLLAKSVEEEIVWISLEIERLNISKNSINDSYKYRF